MRHVVDEIILNFSQAFLTENNVNRENKRNQQNHRKDDGWNHKLHRTEYVIIQCGEENIHKTHLSRRIFFKEQTRIDFFIVMHII